MRYHDLAIEIRPTGAASGAPYTAEVRTGGYGRGAVPFELPVPPEALDRLLRHLEDRVWRSRLRSEDGAPEESNEDRHLPPAGESPDGFEPLSPEVLGGALFSALFRGDTANRFYSVLGSVEPSETDGLRVRFVFDPADADLTELAVVPWELLYRAETRDFLARNPFTPVVRSLDVPRPVRPLRVGPRSPLRVLLAEAAPWGVPPLFTPLEAVRVRHALEQIPGLELTHLERASFDTTQRRLHRGGFHVLHFMGHGDFDGETGEAVLCFEGPGRALERVPAAQLADHLKRSRSVRLVVLNACLTGALPRERGQDPFTAAAAALTMAGVPAVVAMQFSISDRAAIAFAAGFYDALAHGDPLEAAVAEGRLAICREGACAAAEPAGGRREETLEWATSVLYLRGEDGRIVEPAPEEAGAGESGAAEEAPAAAEAGGDRPGEPPLRLGIRSMEGLGHDLEAKAERKLDLVRHFDGRWIRDPALWHEEVLPALHEFLDGAVRTGRPLILDLAAHQTLAFAAGRFLEAKSGVSLSVIQRSQAGTDEWPARPGEVPEGTLWRKLESHAREPVEGKEGREASAASEDRDVAVALSATHEVLEQVLDYLDEARIPAGRVLHAAVHPEPAPTAVRDGAHALRLAQTLGRAIRSRTPAERRGTLHLFAAAPNGLLLFLGQLAPGFGPVQLYEYDFEGRIHGTYRPTVLLRP